MSPYIQEDITLMASHINSTARDGLNGQTPYDLAQLLLDKKIPALLGITRIDADDVELKPSLLEKRLISRTNTKEGGSYGKK